DAEAVHFASCTGTMFASPRDGSGAGAALLELCDRAGVRLRTPAGLGGLCCGTPWKSKGMLDGYRAMSDRVLDALWIATDHGRLPVIVEASSCTEGLVEMVRIGAERGSGAGTSGPDGIGRMRVVDGIDFVASRVLPHLDVEDEHLVETLVLHPTCASAHLGTGGALSTLGRAVARDVVIPEEWGCCAFAGDRGMLHPELTESATAAEAAEVRSLGADAHASSNRTCELGMSRATGRDYEHVLELLRRATRP
ncbi:MAG: heterodisulfide reductase-related iron-sulfur binding cluster, partial [Pseudoclavibacter sp.]